MNLLKKTCLTLTPFLLSALLMTPVTAAPFTAEDVAKETAEETALRLTTAYTALIGSWNVVVKKGQIKSPEKFSFLPEGVLVHTGAPIVISPYNLRFNTGHGAWEQDKYGNFVVRYYRSLYSAADGAYVDDEEIAGTLSFDKNNRLVGELTVGMVKSNGEGETLPGMKITFSGTKINAVKSEKANK